MLARRRSPIARPSPSESEIDYTHKKQTGGSGQFARIKLVFEPLERGEGFVFESKIVGGNVPKEYIPGVQKGLKDSLETGVVAGFPMIDFKVDPDRRRVPRRRLLGHGLRNRRPCGVREGIPKAKPVLLEPIMKVEVVTPEDYTGDVIGDLQQAVAAFRPAWKIAATPRPCPNAMVPLANMFGYVNNLRSMTQGRCELLHAV